MASIAVRSKVVILLLFIQSLLLIPLDVGFEYGVLVLWCGVCLSIILLRKTVMAALLHVAVVYDLHVRIQKVLSEGAQL